MTEPNLFQLKVDRPYEPGPGELLHNYFEKHDPGRNRYLLALTLGEENPGRYLVRNSGLGKLKPSHPDAGTPITFGELEAAIVQHRARTSRPQVARQ